MNKANLLLAASLLSCHVTLAQTFEQISANTSFNNTEGQMIMADLDNDGYPELIQSGLDGFTIFKNENGTLDERVDYPEFIFNNHIFSVDVGDVNRDGFVDILQAGQNYNGNSTAQLLLNSTPGFTNIEGKQLDIYYGSLFLGDFEGDGDLDIVSSGMSGIRLNRNGKWDLGPSFPKYNTWYAAWCNLDNDTELEVLQGHGGSNYFTGNYILESHFPSMTISSTLSLPNFAVDAKFADYDADGDLDMLAVQYGTKTVIHNNVNGDFVDSGIFFPTGRSIDFGDINNDGLYDVVISGMMTDTWWVFETGIYLNQNNGTFSKLDAQIPSYDRARAALGDFDSDGDLDIPSQSGAYKNNSTITNALPTAPEIIGSNVSGHSAELSWQPGSDDKTPVQSLTYNMAVRGEDGTVIVPSHSLPTGKRQIYKMGNAWNNLSFDLTCLKQGTYYWRVQTLDASFQGSAFSEEHSFTITVAQPVAPAALMAKPVSDVRIDLTWVDQSTTEDEFIIFKKAPAYEYSEYYPIDTVSANTTVYADSLYLQPSTTYSYKVVASNCAYPDEFASEASATTFPRAFVDSHWLDLGETEGSMVLLGDYDNDGDLDLLLSHSIAGNTKLYRFDGDKYTDSEIAFPFAATHATWIDYNNDGFIDILFGYGYVFDTETKLYKNVNGTTFEPATDIFPEDFEWQGGVSWGDYDNDGDEDMVLNAAGNIVVYDNIGHGKFTRNTHLSLTGHLKSMNAWADYDNDGDLDILANKEVSCTSTIIVIFENQGNKIFLPIEFPNLEGTNDDLFNYTGDMKWGDYDNDGYPDIIVAGQNTCGNGYGFNRIYRNNGDKTFSPAAGMVQLIYDVNVDWGDYDNDGDLDVFAFGDPFGSYSSRARIYRNDRIRFKETNINYLLARVQYGKASRGDIDHDGDLDYVIAGEIDYVNPRIVVYRNTYAESWGLPNHKPSAPKSPNNTVNSDQSITLSWIASDDDETEQSGLTYNVSIVDENDSLVANSYSLDNGQRKIVSAGNASSTTSMHLKNLKSGTYRWAVQSIDKGFAGSEFSPENSFVVSPVTSTEEKKNSGITLYPNPVKHYLTIVSERTQNAAALDIKDAFGRSVLSIPIDKSEINYDFSLLPTGVYFAIIYNNGARIDVQKIIKN